LREYRALLVEYRALLTEYRALLIETPENVSAGIRGFSYRMYSSLDRIQRSFDGL